MSLTKKVILSLVGSIFFITITNVFSFYFFYNYYLKLYLTQKTIEKQEITLNYINKVIEKQTLDEVNNIFNDIEVLFFELIEKNNGKIPLDKKENIDIVVNYLVKAGVSTKYIEELIPENNLEKIINKVKNQTTPEYIFFNKLANSILLTNLLVIFFLVFVLLIFTKKILLPIRQTTDKIKNLKIGKDFQNISYNKQDEIGLLVKAINDLNIKLNIQENIKTKLLADISHELKTPITSIQCYLEGIKDGVIKLDDKILENITQEMHRLIKLVNKIMDYEKFDNSELELNFEEVDVKFLTEKIINQFKPKLKEQNQKIITLGNEKKLKLDKDSFIQVIQNIISNFLKYSGKETVLKIEFGTNYIRFFDNGKGIKKSEIPYIKEKFYQGKNKKIGNVDDRGIGIGFSIIDKIIKAHNWELEVLSDEGKGFEIKIITKTSH